MPDISANETEIKKGLDFSDFSHYNYYSVKMRFSYTIKTMSKKLLAKIKNSRFPVVMEKDKDGYYVVECPIFRGCFTQGKTVDEALKNIREVIELCLEEKENQDFLTDYQLPELSLHAIAL